MFGKFTAALAAALVLAFTLVQARRPPHQGDSYLERTQQEFCYLPSEPCDNGPRVGN